MMYTARGQASPCSAYHIGRWLCRAAQRAFRARKKEREGAKEVQLAELSARVAELELEKRALAARNALLLRAVAASTAPAPGTAPGSPGTSAPPAPPGAPVRLFRLGALLLSGIACHTSSSVGCQCCCVRKFVGCAGHCSPGPLCGLRFVAGFWVVASACRAGSKGVPGQLSALCFCAACIGQGWPRHQAGPRLGQ